MANKQRSRRGGRKPTREPSNLVRLNVSDQVPPDVRTLSDDVGVVGLGNQLLNIVFTENTLSTLVRINDRLLGLQFADGNKTNGFGGGDGLRQPVNQSIKRR